MENYQQNAASAIMHQIGQAILESISQHTMKTKFFNHPKTLGPTNELNESLNWIVGASHIFCHREDYLTVTQIFRNLS